MSPEAGAGAGLILGLGILQRGWGRQEDTPEKAICPWLRISSVPLGTASLLFPGLEAPAERVGGCVQGGRTL